MIKGLLLTAFVLFSVSAGGTKELYWKLVKKHPKKEQAGFNFGFPEPLSHEKRVTALLEDTSIKEYTPKSPCKGFFNRKPTSPQKEEQPKRKGFFNKNHKSF